jgi:arylsulfatase
MPARHGARELRRALLAALAPALLLPACRAERKLIVLITVDTLRADHLGSYGAPPGTTPALDALGAESIVFERAYAPASCTLPSIAALMTSRYPEELGIESNMSALPPSTTLAAWLQERGWRTGAVVSNLVLRRSSGVDAGFARFDDRMRQRERVREAPERTAVNTTRAALVLLGELLAADRAPVFLWVHYQDPHGPYTPPPGYRRRFLRAEQRAPDGGRELPLAAGVSGVGALPLYQAIQDRRDVAFYRAGYRGEVAYTDAAIAELQRGLDRRGLREQAVVVVTSDHGEGLGEQDYWFAHGERLHEALVRVPLLVHVPGKPPGRRRDVASLLDLFPTLAALAGGAAPTGLRGRGLLAAGAEAASSAVYMSTLRVTPEARRALLSGDYHYLVAGDGPSASESLFRLGDQASSLAGEPALLERLRHEMRAARASLRVGAAAVRQELSPEDREGLAALGYVDAR